MITTHTGRTRRTTMGFLFTLMGLFLLPGLASAQDAHELATQVKDNLLTVIRNKDELEKNGGPEKYYDAVEDVLEPVVDFDYIARGVMGSYAKQASDEQRKRFAEVFKRGLITTYAKGLSGYGQHEINVLPPQSADNERSKSVLLEVRNGDSVNRLAFTMINRENNWLIANMILDGVNLGKTFRNQFAQAMKKSNDLDQVINEWSV